MPHYDMALRLGGLPDLDPAAVPLPVDTDVTTHVDRAPIARRAAKRRGGALR